MFFSSAEFSESSRRGGSTLPLFPPPFKDALNFCAAAFVSGGAAAGVSWHRCGGAETPGPRLAGDLPDFFL